MVLVILRRVLHQHEQVVKLIFQQQKKDSLKFFLSYCAQDDCNYLMGLYCDTI